MGLYRGLHSIVLCLALLAGHAAWAQNAPPQSVGELVLTDSKRDLETQISAILQQRFNLKPQLQEVNNDPEDLIVLISIAPGEDQTVPRINAQVDTVVRTRINNAAKTPLVQVISIASTADVRLKEDKELEVLRLLNTINAQALSAHVYAANRRLVAMQNLTLEANAPLSAAQFSTSFVNVLRVWPSLLKAMRERELLDE
tara:strand:- start:409 stop:1008 length:600 start_codon:yes stop_codon:yes gene_type:complete